MAAVSVTTSATLIATGDGGGSYPSEVVITNDSGNSVYLGINSAVTTSSGIHLADGSTIGLQLVAGRTVYGIAGSTSEVRAEVWS
jgi:hypothetical protein